MTEERTTNRAIAMRQSVVVIIILVFVLVCDGVGGTFGASAVPGEHRRLRSILSSIFEQKPTAGDSTLAGARACEGCSRKITVVDHDDKYNRNNSGFGIANIGSIGIDGGSSRSSSSSSTDDNNKNNNKDEDGDDRNHLPPRIVTEEEFTALRIEYIKNQILKKLRLKKKPKISGAHLPKAVTENEALLPRSEDYAEGIYFDDFYGKTTQAIVFPYEEDARCDKKKRYPSACLPFQMPSDIYATEVSTAELWFHKESDEMDSHNQTFVISEVAHWDSNKSFQKTKPIAIRETNITAGWLKIDVTYVIRNWLEYQDLPTHAINVACKTCGMDRNNSPISFKSALKPFLVIYTHSQTRRTVHRRQKRANDCGNGSHECCREKLYISFAEIGWDDWIIQPSGYNAYFCKGSCTTAASLTLSANQHNSILQKVMFTSTKGPQTRLELTPCCAATQFQPLELLYLADNKTVQKKILPNMIVNACGCM